MKRTYIRNKDIVFIIEWNTNQINEKLSNSVTKYSFCESNKIFIDICIAINWVFDNHSQKYSQIWFLCKTYNIWKFCTLRKKWFICDQKFLKSHFEIILKSFWNHFEIILKSFWNHSFCLLIILKAIYDWIQFESNA